MKGLSFRRAVSGANGLLLLIALAKLLAHLLTAEGYGFFIDELYTIACGRHLAFGYVDIPPLVPALSRLSGVLFGYSPLAARIFPALAGAATVFLAGLTARRLGGGKLAQALAALLVALAPIWLVLDSWIAYDCFDQLMTAFFFYVVLGLLKHDKPRIGEWLLFGAAAGAALMTKGSMLFYGFSFLLGLALSERRKYFAQAGLWIGGALALAIYAPYIIWQWRHGWPMIEFWGLYARFMTYHANPLELLAMNIVAVNPLTLPLWAAGLLFFFYKRNRHLRSIGWMIPILFVLCAVTRAKFYMMTASFMPMLAAGAVGFEGFTIGVRRWLRPAYGAVIALGTAALLPIALPILPADSLAGYVRRVSFLLGVVKTEDSRTAEFPQFIADRFGWDEMVEATASVYNGLSPEEKAECLIVGDSYGHAGAIDLLGPAHGLPPAVSGHLSYFFWGPGDRSGDVAITLSMPLESLKRFYAEVVPAAYVTAPYAMPRNRNMPIYVCRKPLFDSIDEVWPQIKHFD